jgi:phytoene/squalene synthetase
MNRSDTTKEPTGLDLYTRAAEAASAQVIDAYSTSFGWATKLLGSSVRQAIRNIYALVRVADEIVDGAAAEAKARGGTVDPSKALDEFEAETYRALQDGFSTNLVIHAFALTANEVGFGREIIEPFFYSMRQDLTEQEHDQASFDRYVYGSAEVVGLMCLAAFIKFGNLDYTREEKLELANGAQALGAAFQKVNFLRDLAADFKALGRSYFPGVTVENFSEEEKVRLVQDIRADLEVSARIAQLLPANSRRAVMAAQGFFEALNDRIESTPATQLVTTRISVPNSQKLVILLRSYFGISPKAKPTSQEATE